MSEPPYRVAGEVTLEDVEAEVWKLLAARGERRRGADVDGVLETVRRYGESVARKRARGASELERAVERVKKEVEKRVEAGEKRCTSCGEVRPVEEFYRAVSRKDGRQSRCKTCAGERRRQYRASLRDEKRSPGVTETALAGRYTP